MTKNNMKSDIKEILINFSKGVETNLIHAVLINEIYLNQATDLIYQLVIGEVENRAIEYQKELLKDYKEDMERFKKANK